MVLFVEKRLSSTAEKLGPREQKTEDRKLSANYAFGTNQEKHRALLNSVSMNAF